MKYVYLAMILVTQYHCIHLVGELDNGRNY